MKYGFQVQTVLEARRGGGPWVRTFTFLFLLQQSEGILRLGMCERLTS